MRLNGKAIIVTGSTTGIGEAIARRVVAEGARVLVTGRSGERGRRVVAELGPGAALAVCDLADPGAPRQIVDAAIGAFGRIDGIVNNAAHIPDGGLDETDAELLDHTLAINVRAPLLLIREAIVQLEATKGCVLNIGSINAYCGSPDLLAYSMSKGALMTMSRNLGDSLHRDRGVRVNQLNVGWTLTEMEAVRLKNRGTPAEASENPSPFRAPTGKLLTPDEVATAAVYWLSDESRPVSGSIVDLEQYPVIGRNIDENQGGGR